VVAITVILAALLFPTFARAKRSGQEADIRLRLKGLYHASLLYAGDWNTLPYAVSPAYRVEQGEPCGFGNEYLCDLAQDAPLYEDAYAPLGVAASTWRMGSGPISHHFADLAVRSRWRLFMAPDAWALLSEPVDATFARKDCPLFEESYDWRTTDPRAPRLVLFPEGQVHRKTIEFLGINDPFCSDPEWPARP